MGVEQAFLDKISADVQAVAKKNNLFPSMILSQAVIESGSGTSLLASKYKNLFGMKGKGTAGTVSLWTYEEIGGKSVKTKANFRVYNTWGESLEDYARNLYITPNYKKVLVADNPVSAIKEMGVSGYATSSKYGTTLLNTAERLNLWQYDDLNGVRPIIPEVPKNDDDTTSENILDSGGGIKGQNTMFGLPDINFGDILFKTAWLVPALILMVLGILFLFGEQIQRGALASATGGTSELIGGLKNEK